MFEIAEHNDVVGT